MRKLHPYVDLDYPVVLAHRGDSMHAPENTFPAFQMAAEAGVDGLETDVHWTRDGVIVVCHDETVDRTSNGHGAIADMTFAQLQKLDFGYHFTPDNGQTYPYRDGGVKIPKFSEFLMRFPNLRVNIDMKAQHPQSVQQFIREVFDCGAEMRVLAASFHHDVLKQLRSMNGTIATSASTLETVKFCMSTWMHWCVSSRLPYCALQVPERWNGLPIVTPGFVVRAHDAGVKVHVWTIDEEEIMKSLFQIGVDGVMTNDPSLAVRVRNQHTQVRSA